MSAIPEFIRGCETQSDFGPMFDRAVLEKRRSFGQHVTRIFELHYASLAFHKHYREVFEASGVENFGKRTKQLGHYRVRVNPALFRCCREL